MTTSALLITEDERRRFAAFCHASALNYHKMSKLIGFEPAAERERQKAAAFKIVACEIDPENRETETVRG